jgi:hypothetical protein
MPRMTRMISPTGNPKQNSMKHRTFEMGRGNHIRVIRVIRS